MSLRKMRKLINELNEANRLYNLGQPQMTDEEYDNKYFELKELEQSATTIYPDSPTQTIIYNIVNALEKSEHNHKMLSLDKTKEQRDIVNFINDHDFVAMLKMDGLTCSLTYEGGFLVKAETRGNGLVGEDVTHNAMVIPSIPKQINMEVEGPIVVDGEIICKYDDFEEFSTKYKNPRNFAAGSIRLLDANECAKRKLTFVAWDLIKYQDPSIMYNMHKRLDKLESLGFCTVPYYHAVLTGQVDIGYIQLKENFIRELASKNNYPIDGLVYKFDDIEYGDSLGETSHHFNNAIAFKFYDEIYESTLIDIDWTMGRQGSLCPVAVFEPVDDGVSIVTRASLHNLSIMNDLYDSQWYVGLSVGIFKANEIIPQVAWIKDSESICNKQILIPDVCPECGGRTEIRMSNAGIRELWCANEQCPGKLINIIDHFVGKKGLDIKGISKATIEKLIDWGWIVDIASVFTLKEHRDEWVRQPGFGQKSVDNILNAIEASKTSSSLEKFISALGIPRVGPTAAKEIANREKSWGKFREDVKNKFDFSKWPGLGMEITQSLWNYDYTLADYIIGPLRFDSGAVANNEPRTKVLAGKIFVITGSLELYKNREELKKNIEANGGRVTAAISRNTSYLINNDINSSSSKNMAAKKLNIPIITEREYVKNFLI